MTSSDFSGTAPPSERPFWWEDAAPLASEGALPSRVDTVIVGAGLCGLSAGIRSLELGTSTLVLDAVGIGGMASSRSGAMASGGQKLLLGGAGAGLPRDLLGELSRAHAEAFAFVRDLSRQDGMAFDFQACGRLFLASLPRDLDRFRNHARILSEEGGVTARLLSRAELAEEIDTGFYHGGLLVEEYGGLHPARFGRALASRYLAAGGAASAPTAALRVGREGGGFRVETSRGDVLARHVLFATNGYTDGALPWLRRRITPVSSYIVATERLPADLMRRLMPTRRMYSDSKRNLWYFRPSPAGDRILFGGRPGIIPGSPRAVAAGLLGYLRQVFPALAGTSASHCWSGQVGMTRSRLQHIGAVEGVHYAVGCNGSGVAIMPFLGRLAAERMIGHRRVPTVFERLPFRRFPPPAGLPWFVPLAAAASEAADWLDLRRSAA